MKLSAASFSAAVDIIFAQKNRLSVFIVVGDSLVAEYSEIASAFGYVIISPDKIKNLRPIVGKVSFALELSNLDLDRKKAWRYWIKPFLKQLPFLVRRSTCPLLTNRNG